MTVPVEQKIAEMRTLLGDEVMDNVLQSVISGETTAAKMRLRTKERTQPSLADLTPDQLIEYALVLKEMANGDEDEDEGEDRYKEMGERISSLEKQFKEFVSAVAPPAEEKKEDAASSPDEEEEKGKVNKEAGTPDPVLAAIEGLKALVTKEVGAVAGRVAVIEKGLTGAPPGVRPSQRDDNLTELPENTVNKEATTGPFGELVNFLMPQGMTD